MSLPELSRDREQYCQRLADALQRIIAALACRPDVERAILFGSYAAGRRDLLTDLDILIVADSTSDFVTRTVEMYGYLNADVDLDLIVYTPQEFERRRTHGFVRRAVEQGVLIYEKSAC